MTSTPRSSFVPAYAVSRRLAIAVISVCACAIDTPAFSRASVRKPRLPRFASGVPLIAKGIHTSALSVMPVNPAGMTPTTDVPARAKLEVSTDDRGIRAELAAPQLVAQHDDASRSATSSSSARNARPAAGATDSKAKYGAETASAVIGCGSPPVSSVSESVV